MWQVVFTRQAVKDSKKIKEANLKDKVQELLDILSENPFKNPPPYEKLVGDLTGAYSRRITIQHRLVYEVFADKKMVRVLRIWTNYE